MPRERQLETFKAAAEINGGTVENRAPALDGMISTVLKYGKIFLLIQKDEKRSCGENRVQGTRL